MKRSTRAALFSGLVFPGMGHVYLRKYWPGVVLILIAGAAIYCIVSMAVDTALSIAGDIESGVVPLDVEVISKLIAQRSQSAEHSAKGVTMVFIATWVVGIFDAYRAGRAQERTRHGADQNET